VINITDSQADYAKEVTKSLQNNGFRAICDLRNEKIGFKIRAHSIQRIPFILVVGDKERESQTVAVRTRDGDDLGSLQLDQVMTIFSEEIQNRRRVFVETE
jgi:threonyl-tRNA synthetase